MEKRFLGIVELGHYLDVSNNTLRYWVWQRKIPYFKMGKLVKFDIIEIEKWLKDKKIKELS